MNLSSMALGPSFVTLAEHGAITKQMMDFLVGIMWMGGTLPAKEIIPPLNSINNDSTSHLDGLECSKQSGNDQLTSVLH